MRTRFRRALVDDEIRVVVVRWDGGEVVDTADIVRDATKPFILVISSEYRDSLGDLVKASHLCYSDYPVPFEINSHDGDAV